MAGMMRHTADARGWRADAPAKSAGRRAWASTAWLVAGTIAVAVTSYSLSLKVAAERRDVERLARTNAGLNSDLKALEAELRVRMRMPQLQRWNDTVLGMVPISATQYLANPVQLAAYGDPLPAAGPSASLPRAQLAVRDLVPGVAADPAQARPLLVRAEATPAAPAMTRAALLAAGPAIERPAAAEAPADLLLEVELNFAGSGGPNP